MEIKQLFELRESNPNEWTASTLAERFGIEVAIVESMLQNYALPKMEEIKPQNSPS